MTSEPEPEATGAAAAKSSSGTGGEGFFPAQYFQSPGWARVAAALPLIAAASNGNELWDRLTADSGEGPVSNDPRLIRGGDDYEPVLDAIQAGSDGDDFSPPCDAMPGVFGRIIPRIAALVGQAPALFAHGPHHDQQPLPLMHRGRAGEVTVSHAQVASLMAMAFLGVGLPPSAYARGRSSSEHPDPDELGEFPLPSMLHIVWPKRGLDFPPHVHKVRCFLCYFSRFEDHGAASGGKLTIQRAVATATDRELLSSLATSETPLCELDVQPLRTSIEDQRGCARVDFANRMIGGGVWLSGPGAASQEEITFATHPDLCAAKLLCAQMADDEALLLSGARHAAMHTGYSETFRYVGPASGEVADATWVAIDALPLPDEQPTAQFLGKGTAREALKALVGFRAARRTTSTIATGNWGCGAFNGCPEVKALVQWVAASEAGVSQLRYHLWDDDATHEALMRLAALHEGGVDGGEVSVGQLWTAAQRAAKDAGGGANSCDGCCFLDLCIRQLQ